MVIGKVISQTHFNRDPHILGKTFRVSDLPSKVVGVMPYRIPRLFMAGRWIYGSQSIRRAKRYVERSDRGFDADCKTEAGCNSGASSGRGWIPSQKPVKQDYQTSNKGISKKL